MDAEAEEPPGMPRWVKVFVAIGVAFALLVVAVLVLGDGEHGPGRHSPSRHTGSSDTVPESCSADPFDHAAGEGVLLACDEAKGGGATTAGSACADPGHGGLAPFEESFTVEAFWVPR